MTLGNGGAAAFSGAAVHEMKTHHRPSRQQRIEDLPKVFKLKNPGVWGAGQDELARLKGVLEAPDAPAGDVADALRLLACYELDVKDLQQSGLGPVVRRLRRAPVLDAQHTAANPSAGTHDLPAPAEEIRRLATNLIKRWRCRVVEVERFKARVATTGPGKGTRG